MFDLLLMYLAFHYSLLSIIYTVLPLNLMALYIHSQMLLLYLLVLYMYTCLPVDNSLCYMFTPLYPMHLTYYVLHMYGTSYLLTYLYFMPHPYNTNSMFMPHLYSFMLYNLLCLLLSYNLMPLDYYLFPNILLLLIPYLYMFMLISGLSPSNYLLYLSFTLASFYPR